MTATNTIGMEGVARCNARTLGLALAKMTSGASATNSVAYLEMLLTQGSNGNRCVRCAQWSSRIPAFLAGTPQYALRPPDRRQPRSSAPRYAAPVPAAAPAPRRPRRCRAAEQREELASPDESCHLIPPAGRAKEIVPSSVHVRALHPATGIRRTASGLGRMREVPNA